MTLHAMKLTQHLYDGVQVWKSSDAALSYSYYT